MTLSFEAYLIMYWQTVCVYARGIRYAINFSTMVKKGLRKLQRTTRVLYIIFSNSNQTGFASYNELLKYCTEFFNSSQTGLVSFNERLKCCRGFSFQYNGLLYCAACACSKAYTVVWGYPAIDTIHGASGICMRCMRRYGSV